MIRRECVDLRKKRWVSRDPRHSLFLFVADETGIVERGEEDNPFRSADDQTIGRVVHCVVLGRHVDSDAGNDDKRVGRKIYVTLSAIIVYFKNSKYKSGIIASCVYEGERFAQILDIEKSV